MRWTTLITLTLTLLAMGCSQSGREVRKRTYPPDFSYLEDDKLHSAMWQLARNAEAINHDLRDLETGEVSDTVRADVIARLEAMEKATATLTTDAGRTNHPMIGQNIDKFRHDVKAARHAVEADPPNYYLAGSIAGACQYCHKPSARPM